MKIPFLEKRKFVLIIGDEGAVLSFFDNGKVEKRLFAMSASLTDRREINALFTKHPSVPIYILLDTMEQSYTKQTLPAVGSLAIGKLVKKRLERDFAQSDIKGAVLFGRDNEGRRDWVYMFAAAPVTKGMSEWMDYISSLENKFVGIYMLPVEMQNFAKKLNKQLIKKPKGGTPWQFIVTHNKTGGFRQVVLHNERVIFTRLIRSGKDNLPDIIAGNIEQEILNTIDYLRRLTFGDEEQIDVVAIVSKDIKKSLESTKIRGKQIELFTPFEVATAMKMDNVAGKDDKFSDLVFSASFVDSSPVLKLENPKMKQVNSLLNAYYTTTIVVFVLLPLLALYCGYLAFSIVNINSSLKESENEKARIEREWKDARKTDEYNIDEANKITDFVKLYEKFSGKSNPLDLVLRIGAAQDGYAQTVSFDWSSIPDSSAKNSNAKKQYNLSSSVNMSFYNSGDNVESLFENFDKFTNIMKKELSTDYDVIISELPDKVTFDSRERAIDVQVKISSKTEGKKR